MWDRDIDRMVSIVFRVITGVFSVMIHLVTLFINSIRRIIMKWKIERENCARRGISDVLLHSAEQCINSHVLNNSIIVCANNTVLRSELNSEIVKKQISDHQSVVLFYSGNKELENRIRKKLGSQCVIVSQKGVGFDPFIGLSDDQICRLVYESVKSNQFIKLGSSGEAYLRGVLLFLTEKRIQPLFRNINRCINFSNTTKFDTLIDLVQEEIQSNKIETRTGNRIIQLLLTGQAELARLKEIFETLNTDLEKYCFGSKRASIPAAIKEKKAIAIDVSGFDHDITLGLLTGLLEYSERKVSSSFGLVIDSIAYMECKTLSKFLHTHMACNTITLTGQNILQMMCGSEQEWSAVAGSATTMFIGKQSGSNMAKLLSEYYGTYEKIVENWGQAGGRGNNVFSLFSTSVHNTTHEAYSEATKPKLSISDFQSMGPMEIIISDESSFQIDRVQIVEV